MRSTFISIRVRSTSTNMPRKSTYMEKFTGVMLESKYGVDYIIHNSEAFPTCNVTPPHVPKMASPTGNGLGRTKIEEKGHTENMQSLLTSPIQRHVLPFSGLRHARETTGALYQRCPTIRRRRRTSNGQVRRHTRQVQAVCIAGLWLPPVRRQTRKR